ncbi:MAG: chloroplast Clp protease [Monoraphidium minutum]|nr:MAG: chloroplast Clp protease [Monoraphidium minutum]
MRIMNERLRSIVGERHPVLLAAADQIFGAGGKKLRPMTVLLMARATMELGGLSEMTSYHRRLAEIIEMIHTASLVHDDVLDEASLRRGKDTVNSIFGTKVAVLVGDFLFAQSSWHLANLDNLEVIKLISQVIADFANGEISQAASLFDTEVTLETYLDKSFYKTASLIAASCRSSAVFSGASEPVKEAMYDYGKHLGLAFQEAMYDYGKHLGLAFQEAMYDYGKHLGLAFQEAMYDYGKHLGLAFQVVDDILDFTQTAEQLGKPQGQDLASGNLTAPAIFALRRSPELAELIESEFAEDGSLDRAISLVSSAGGVEAARQLAREEADKALAALAVLPASRARRSLELMVDYVLDRIY